MEIIKNNSKKIILTFGLISGFLSILLTVIIYTTDNILKPSFFLYFLSLFIPIFLIVLGIRKFKLVNSGYIKWIEAVKLGVGITIISGVLSLSFQYVLENYIDPTLIEQKIELIRENFDIDQDKIDDVLEQQKNINPFYKISFGLLIYSFCGFVISAIVGAIIKKQ